MVMIFRGKKRPFKGKHFSENAYGQTDCKGRGGGGVKQIGSTRSASIWGLLWRNPKGFLILTTFRGCTSHFRFDLFYIVDLHSALTFTWEVRAEWISTLYKRSKRKWLVHSLKLVKIKNPFGFLQTNHQILAERVEPFFSSKLCFRETP